MTTWTEKLRGVDTGRAPEEDAERAAYWASPVGQAESARFHGLGFFQVEIPIRSIGGASAFGNQTTFVLGSGGRPDILSQIEAKGWRLENVGYVFVETGATSTNHFLTTGQGTATHGHVLGIYLFRAV